MASRPSTPPPLALPMAIIGATAVNVTPCSSGSRTPTFQKPTAWISDAMPQVSRSALIRYTRSSPRSPIALASRIGTITAPA